MIERPNISKINDMLIRHPEFRITAFGAHIDNMREYEVGVLINHINTPNNIFSERRKAFRNWTPDELTPVRKMGIFLDIEPSMYKIPDEVLAGHLNTFLGLMISSILTKLRVAGK